ncbi:MAG: immune inhibitor A, partial [Anaerolineae bacterium]|nr:immune inhibitor A [Anaerolineae bacterium]
LTLRFEGNADVPVVPTEARSGQHLYWANRSDQSNPRLTRAFDLRAVKQATLNFHTWYEMEPFWDYGYVSLSTDGGATWQPLESAATLDADPNNRAFAPGLTGFSVGGVASRPAPFLGVSFDAESGTILELVPGSSADSAGIKPGDKLVAIGATALADPAQLVTLLNQYQAHDTVLFSIVRDGESLDVPVTLGAHPERTLRPSAAWAQESIDLTPYTGHEVLIRFEYVTDQAFTRNGWVLDDISIPEIGYYDDAETADGWIAEGWARISNTLPQDFLVQVISGAEKSVTRALLPGEGQAASWTLDIGPDAPATVIISGMTRYTTQPGTYSLHIDPVE